MKHQYKQEGFDPSKLVIEDYDMTSYVNKLNKLVNMPATEKRHTTITFIDKPIIFCPKCGIKLKYKVYNHMGWEWPSYLTHMMFYHKVKPSQEFLDAVLRDTP